MFRRTIGRCAALPVNAFFQFVKETAPALTGLSHTQRIAVLQEQFATLSPAEVKALRDRNAQDLLQASLAVPSSFPPLRKRPKHAPAISPATIAPSAVTIQPRQRKAWTKRTTEVITAAEEAEEASSVLGEEEVAEEEGQGIRARLLRKAATALNVAIAANTEMGSTSSVSEADVRKLLLALRTNRKINVKISNKKKEQRTGCENKKTLGSYSMFLKLNKDKLKGRTVQDWGGAMAAEYKRRLANGTLPPQVMALKKS